MASFLSSLRNVKKRKKGKQDPPGSFPSLQAASQSKPSEVLNPANLTPSIPGNSSEVDLVASTLDFASNRQGKPSSHDPVAKTTTLNVFKLTLATLGQVSDNIPVPGLKLATEGLLSVIEKVQETFDNSQGFRELAKRLEDLQPIFLQMQTLDKGTTSVIKYLNQLEVEIRSLTEEIAQASSPGAIVRFFNSADDVKSLKKHTSNLDEIIRGAALAISVDTNQQVKLLYNVAITAAQSERFKSLKGWLTQLTTRRRVTKHLDVYLAPVLNFWRWFITGWQPKEL